MNPAMESAFARHSHTIAWLESLGGVEEVVITEDLSDHAVVVRVS